MKKSKILYMWLAALVISLTQICNVIAGEPGIQENSGLRIAVFDIDATPPVGSRLAYNTMINKWELGLRARGIILTGSGQPIVLCSIDWIGISNEGQDVFRKAMAEA